MRIWDGGCCRPETGYREDGTRCGRFGRMREIPESLALLRPDDLFPVWCLVDSLEQAGEMAADDAVRWKHGIYGLMVLWGLEPDDLIPAVLM